MAAGTLPALLVAAGLAAPQGVRLTPAASRHGPWWEELPRVDLSDLLAGAALGSRSGEACPRRRSHDGWALAIRMRAVGDGGCDLEASRCSGSECEAAPEEAAWIRQRVGALHLHPRLLRAALERIRAAWRAEGSSLLGVSRREASPWPKAEAGELLDEASVEASHADPCAICLHQVNRSLRLPCGHRFCSLCIRRWLHRSSSCPTCRRPAEWRPTWSMLGASSAVGVVLLGAGGWILATVLGPNVDHVILFGAFQVLFVAVAGCVGALLMACQR